MQQTIGEVISKEAINFWLKSRFEVAIKGEVESAVSVAELL